MEQIPCIFCRALSRNVAITENGFNGVRCDNCKLIYISPRPNAAEVADLYTNEHAVLYADAQFRFQDVYRMEAARTLSKIQRYKTGGSMLELGPGGGSFLSEARRRGYEPHAVELNPIEARWISEDLGIPCESVPLSENSFTGKQFDVIYHKDVLSHLHDPIRTFHDINRALKSDGLLVFETGNIADVDQQHLKYFSQFSYPDHLFFFGERSLDMLLEQTGFRRLHVHRESILLQLLLQKMLWRVKDSLKDKTVVADMRSQKNFNCESGGLSVKRRLRILYRYASRYLIRLGAVLPKKGMPLKLLVFAQKDATRAS